MQQVVSCIGMLKPAKTESFDVGSCGFLLGMLKPAKVKPFDVCCIALQACAGAFCVSI